MDDSPKTMQKLCFSTKFLHQEIRWNYGILRSGRVTSIFTLQMKLTDDDTNLVTWFCTSLFSTSLFCTSLFSTCTSDFVLVYFMQITQNQGDDVICYFLLSDVWFTFLLQAIYGSWNFKGNINLLSLMNHACKRSYKSDWLIEMFCRWK